ncbi:MAG: 2-phospho-L-lactate guanylyltransferase [Anaerolineales bacterium]|nr:2-phospho-L-lactate guanylyltransferase [Anaerolineales bacterium]MCW5854773.1 2-phospho-L-lactate guanylyltransferase [Anaerolineales bacterium]
MALWAIVPVKPLRRGKSRLAGVLSEDERAALNQRLLLQTVDVLSRVPDVKNILVISRDPEALALAREQGARTLQEDGAPHLNVALQRATVVAKTYMATSILIVPADLPQITTTDIQALIDAASEPGVAVIAPDHRREGTNALLLNPVGDFPYDFGPDSFARHSRLAQEAGLQVKVLELESLAHDVDVPEDLSFLGELDY